MHLAIHRDELVMESLLVTTNRLLGGVVIALGRSLEYASIRARIALVMAGVRVLSRVVKGLKLPEGDPDVLSTDQLRDFVRRWGKVLTDFSEAHRRATAMRGLPGVDVAVMDELVTALEDRCEALEEHIHDLLDIIDGRTIRLDPNRKFVSLEEMESRLGLH